MKTALKLLSWFFLVITFGCVSNPEVEKTNFPEKNIKWIINDNGTYSIQVSSLIIRNCFPAIDAQSIAPLSVSVNRTDKGGSIKYDLGDGVTLQLILTEDSNSLVLKSKFLGNRSL